MKKLVGIIANTLGFDSDNPFDDKYFSQNQYVEAVYNNGGIPIIIPPINLEINNDALEVCDAFLITGGKIVHKYHLDVVDYAIKHNKKLLGICMGMQVIGMYSNNDLKEETLMRINDHYYDQITHKNKDLLTHKVYFSNNSALSSLLGKEILVNSIHRFALKYVSYPFVVVGKDKNGVIEAIEYKNIIGVQFHPELMKHTDNLFKWLIN